MPTKNPRVMVTLNPKTYAVLKSMAESVGASMSSIISELADEAAPALQNIQKAMQMAKTKPSEAFDQLAHQLAQAQSEAAQLQLDMHERKHNLKRRSPKNAKSTT